ncbi:EAL domain-containing protein [Nocardia sp. NPDC058518]|uniref:caspase, EACC1-associated type n=1 Tax=Nocardia sp. NPDC058518 TaxID=3346534 RepID=UPI00364E934E
MARLVFPQLPPGPLYDLMSALHELHDRAGWLSTRDIARKVGKVSHHTVAELFKSTTLPKLPLLMSVVDVLAQESRRPTTDREQHISDCCDAIDQLWTRARLDEVTPTRLPTQSMRNEDPAADLVVTAALTASAEVTTMGAFLPDRDRSMAVMAGVTNYATDALASLPGTSSSVQQLAHLLTDPADPVIDSDNLILLDSPTRAETLDGVRRAADQATDSLIVYFAGHGLISRRGELLLAASDTDPDIEYTAIAYQTIRELVVASKAKRVLVVIDACAAGQALTDEVMGPLDGLVRIPTSLVIASTGPYQAALRDVGGPVFTRAFTNILRDGIDGGPELLDVVTVFEALREVAQRSHRFPIPYISGETGDHPLALARNRAGQLDDPAPRDLRFVDEVDDSLPIVDDRQISPLSLVTEVAKDFMAADSETVVAAAERVLAKLVDFFGVEFGYLRHTDHDRRRSVLVAEWPHRTHTPDPDPFAVIDFTDADPVIHQLEHLTDPLVVYPVIDFASYWQLFRRARGISVATSVTVPLLSHGEPSGALGFAASGQREWTPSDLYLLKTVAALFALLDTRVLAEEQLRYMALHDDLTGLLNQHALMGKLVDRLETGRPGPVAMLFLDLDRLKSLNSFLGHSAGRNFVRALASRLKQNLEPTDMIARFGGGEFVIVLHEPMDVIAAELEAQRIQQVVQGRVTLGSELVSRAASVGVAVADPGETSASELVRRAERALQAAQSDSNSGIAVFTDAMHAQFELRDDVELNLRKAISDGSLLLHYQPEVDLRTGSITGVEALVRWQHPTRGLLPPAMFVPAAEATNLAGELGRWVIKDALAEFARWRREGLAERVVLRINVSPAQLVSLDFVERIESLLRRYGVDGSSICLEITEHVVVQDLTRTRITLRGLKRLGIQIAIDDFGTGSSSLSHLKALPVDAVKLDRGFVQRLGDSNDDLVIVKAIMGLAGSFGLGVVGKGVETAAAARTLVGLGCYRAQGFLIARPMPAEDMMGHLVRGRIELDFDLPRHPQTVDPRPE